MIITRVASFMELKEFQVSHLLSDNKVASTILCNPWTQMLFLSETDTHP